MKITRGSVNSLVAALVMYATTVAAQPERPSTVDVIPHSSDAFVLTPSSPTATRPLVLDRVPRADIMVSALSNDLDIILISPRRVRYVIGQNRPDFESFVSPHEGLGANYRAILKNPVAGTWTLQVTARRLAGELDVVVNLLLQSEVFVALVAGDMEHRVGSVAALSLAAFEGTRRLRDVRIEATLLTPGGSAAPPVFRDDGAGGDVDAADGIYTAFVTLSTEGEYRIDATVRGTAATGDFERTTAATLVARHPSASFADGFSDEALDVDGDGFTDVIAVRPTVDVGQAGKYHLSARLRSRSGAILQSTEIVELTPGIISPAVQFAAPDVRERLAEDGPYAVEMLLLERHDGENLVFVDRRMEAGVTRAYELQELVHRERTRVLAPQTVTGYDRDANGYFDELHVTIDLEADFAGDYWYSATLVAGDEDIDSLNGTLSLDRGRNQVLLRFDATAIGMRRLDGPYQVVLRMFGPTEAAGLSARFKTQPFTANQFEGFIPDTTPPEVWGWVRPTILWPPDHRMVEIDVGYGASDDRDIRPSIALESIVASEGENALGDGNTSPDIVVEGHRVFLRAERSGTGSDRVYTFTFVARDRAGNTARMTAAVRVPHDGGGQ